MAAKRMIYKVLGVVVGVVFVGAGIKDRTHMSHLQSVGKIAVVDPIEGYSVRKSRGYSTYTAEFRFTAQNGVKIVKKQRFPEALVADVDARQPVNVLYDPNNPHDFIFERERERTSWMMVLGGLGLAVAVFLLA